MAIWLPFVLAGLVAGSQLVTNPEDLGKRFARAQKLLAIGDFAGAQRIYGGVLEVPDGMLLRASAVRVVVDEHAVGVQAAARYQLANMARKQAQWWQQEAVLADSVAADSLAGLATGSFGKRRIALLRCAMRKALNCARPRRTSWWSAFSTPKSTRPRPRLGRCCCACSPRGVMPSGRAIRWVGRGFTSKSTRRP